MWSRRSSRVVAGAAVLFVLGGVLAPLCGPALDLGLGSHRFILWDLRVPRAALGLVAGAALAAAGVVMQAILRNPLATPYTLGVSSGSALGVVLAVALGIESVLEPLVALPAVGMAGAILVIALTYRVARVRGRLPAPTLLLAGVALTYTFSALILAIQYTSTPEDALRILRWLVGSLESGYGLRAVAIVGIAAAAGIAYLAPLGRAFNALAGGEESAMGVGVDVERVIRRAYLASSLMVGAVVAFVGPIGFIGLLVPHTLRLLGLADNRLLLPASALAGGGFLALCDGLSNFMSEPHLPVGVLTHLLGGPFFLVILLREKQRM